MAVFERQTLDNGLRVLTAPLPHAQSVACFVMLAAGSRYEEQSQSRHRALRRAHVLQGHESAARARAHLTTLVDGIGGEFNAFTSKEYTGYYVRCAGADRDIALDVLIDMIRNSKFDPEEIEREKGVILEEMNMYFDTPRDYIGSVYEALMFGDNPLGWETLGTKDTIKGANRDTFTDYVNQLVHARPHGRRRQRHGRQEPRPDAREHVRRDARRTAAPSSSRRRCTTPATGRTSACTSKESDQAQICIGVPSLPLEHPDRYALQLLATVLGTGMSSRLFLEVRERRGLAYYVYGSNHSYTDAGSLYAQAGVDLDADRRRDHASSSTSSSAWPTRRCRRRSSRRRASLAKGRFVLHTESPQSLLMFGLRREVLEGKALEPRRILAELDKVTARTSSASRRT